MSTQQMMDKIMALERACAEMRHMLNAAALATDIDWPDNYEFGKDYVRKGAAVALRGALARLQRGADPHPCWCEVAIEHPLMEEHSEACRFAQRVWVATADIESHNSGNSGFLRRVGKWQCADRRLTPPLNE